MLRQEIARQHNRNRPVTTHNRGTDDKTWHNTRRGHKTWYMKFDTKETTGDDITRGDLSPDMKGLSCHDRTGQDITQHDMTQQNMTREEMSWPGARRDDKHKTWEELKRQDVTRHHCVWWWCSLLVSVCVGATWHSKRRQAVTWHSSHDMGMTWESARRHDMTGHDVTGHGTSYMNSYLDSTSYESPTEMPMSNLIPFQNNVRLKTCFPLKIKFLLKSYWNSYGPIPNQNPIKFPLKS